LDGNLASFAETFNRDRVISAQVERDLGAR